jgi:hypothetical protein
MGRGSNRSRVDGNEDIKHGIGVEGVGYNGVCLLLVDEMKCSNVSSVFLHHITYHKIQTHLGTFIQHLSFIPFIHSLLLHPSILQSIYALSKFP